MIILHQLASVQVGDDFRIQSNNELYELRYDIDVVQHIKIYGQR